MTSTKLILPKHYSARNLRRVNGVEMVEQYSQLQQAGGAAPQMTPQQMNGMARNAVLAMSQSMEQPILTTTLSGTIPAQIITVPFRNVGLIKRFVVEITFNVAQAAAETLNLTKLGPSNILSNVTLTDLSNTTRINTTGWHLHQLATVRRGSAFGAAFLNDSPVSNGSSFGVIKAPAAVTASQQVRMFYEIPVCYSDLDLRGAIYANVVNATGQLQLTVNPNMIVGSAADPVGAVYQSSTAGNLGVISNFQVAVYQVFLDQLPQAQNGQPVLPMLDLSTNYYLNSTVVGGLTVNQDNPIPYSNFREYLSTMVLYDNNGALNSGTDINRFKMQTANQLSLFDVDPYYLSLLTREEIGNDMPPGMYYFNHRRKPINTVQYGNMQLMVNPSSVASAAGSFAVVGWESMGIANMVTQAGSLYGN